MRWSMRLPPLPRAVLRRLLVMLAGLGAAAGLVASALQTDSTRSPAAPTIETRLYDLQAAEARGGHTLERHVGKTDRDLAERLEREPQISSASTYTDADTARRVVAAALAQSRGKVGAWAARSGRRPNLVVKYVQPDGRAIGRSLARGARVSATCTRAVVVLRWDVRRRRWFVLTSYPEAPR